MDRKRLIRSVLSLIGGALPLLFCSCKNDPEEVRALNTDVTAPPQEIINFDLVQVDSGRIRLDMHAGKVVIEQVKGRSDRQTRRGSEGVEFIVYNKRTGAVESKLTANQAIEYGDKDMAEAIGNVIAINEKGDSLLTERLIWDKSKKIYYSDEFTRIIQNGDVIKGRKGFRSNEDFTKYTLFQSEGLVSIKDSLN